MTVRARLAGTVATALLVVLVACSSGSAKSTAHDTGSTSVGVSTTAAPTFTGAGSGPFCAKARTAEDQLNQAAAGATTPDGLRSQITAAVAAVHDLVQVAPSEIAADTKALAAAYDNLVAAMTQAGWDYSKLSQQTDAALDAPSVRVSGDRLQAYERQVCGIKTG